MCYDDGTHTSRVEEVTFALLEAAPVALDTLLGVMVATPYTGPPDGYDDATTKRSFQKCRMSASIADWMLTPSQGTDEYINAISAPLEILYRIAWTYRTTSCTKSGGGTGARLDRAFFHRIEQHVLFPKFLQRLFRLVAQVRLRTAKAVSSKFGTRVEGLLLMMADLNDQVDSVRYNIMFGYAEGRGTHVGMPGSEATVEKLLREEDVTSFDELREFLKELIPDDVASRFTLYG
jgi:hypothetical protein